MKASVIHRFKKPLATFQDSFSNAQKKRSEKNVHALRVSIKRIHALLRFAAFISPNTVNAKKTYKKWKGLFTEAGKLRTLHIHIALLAESKMNGSITAEIKNLERKAREQRGKVKKELQSFNSSKRLRQLKEIVRQVFAHEEQLQAKTLAFAVMKFKQARECAHEKDFHGARKALKHAHYVLELFPSDKYASALLAAIDPIEKKAGRWQDIRSFLQLLDGEKQKKKIRFPNKRFLQELKTLETGIQADIKKAESKFTAGNF